MFRTKIRPMTKSRYPAVWVVCTVTLLAGCGGPGAGDRLAISGTVKWKGEPLAEGTIDFVAADQNRTGGMIQNGAYKIPREQGLPPGKYQVVISSIAGSGVVSSEPPGPEAMSQSGSERLPP